MTLKDNKGEAVKNYKLDVVINGKSYVYTTNSLGQVKISTKTWSPKAYQISISTSEKNTHYFTVTKDTQVLVKKAVPKLTASAKIYYLKDKTKKYVAVLKTNTNQVLKNAKVTLNVGGKTYSIKTNAKGQAIFSLNKLNKKGSFKAIIKFAGNGYYTAINKNVYIKVNNQKPQLISSKKTFSLGAKTKKITAILKTSKGKILKGKSIVFTVNGKKYTVKTDSKGVATLNAKLTKKGKYTCNIKYAGDATYSPIAKNIAVVIK